MAFAIVQHQRPLLLTIGGQSIGCQLSHLSRHVLVAVAWTSRARTGVRVNSYGGWYHTSSAPTPSITAASARRLSSVQIVAPCSAATATCNASPALSLSTYCSANRA